MADIIDLIPVRQEHLDEGCKGRMNNCGLALALKEKYKADQVLVGTTAIFGPGFNIAVKPGHLITGRLGEVTQQWLKSFDQGIMLKPCVFILHFEEYGKGVIYHISDIFKYGLIIEGNPTWVDEYKRLEKEINEPPTSKSETAGRAADYEATHRYEYDKW